jgi:flavin-dependent thymidylate synthase
MKERKKMKVELIDYTGAGTDDPARHAANVLVFTKQTRLSMDPNQMECVKCMSDSEIEDELEYMANTIPSSWEFVHYTFLINGVTRGFTHQFVRTRTGSYAQQTMRVLNVDGWEFGTGPTIAGDENLEDLYSMGMDEVSDIYESLIRGGAAIEDARGILPTNILTNIVAGFSLRIITDLVRKRSSSRTQGEYREVLEAMKSEVIRVHPWSEMFINRNFDVAADELDNRLLDLAGDNSISEEQRYEMVKLLDQMRKG